MMNEVHSSREFRVLVTGGRGYQNCEAVFERLATCRESAARNGLKLIVIHGDCPTGADHWAALWSRREGIDERRYPAQWNLHGRSAGPRRNQQMVTEGQPDLVVAFPGGRGTADLVRRARAADVLVAHLESEVGRPLACAVQRVFEAEMVADHAPSAGPAQGAARDEEQSVTDPCDLGR